MLQNQLCDAHAGHPNFGTPRDEQGLAPVSGGAYEPGLYRVQITDYGFDDWQGEQALWLEFLPLSRIERFPGDIHSGGPTLHGPRCRQFFDVEGGTFDGDRPSTPVELLRGLRALCLEAGRYGRPDPLDAYGLIGRQAVARCERREPGGQNAWWLVPVRHTYPRPGCDCGTCRDYRKRRRRR
jgi:hypothetical protein